MSATPFLAKRVVGSFLLLYCKVQPHHGIRMVHSKDPMTRVVVKEYVADWGYNYLFLADWEYNNLFLSYLPARVERRRGVSRGNRKLRRRGTMKAAAKTK
jgi:hypothetical protein